MRQDERERYWEKTAHQLNVSMIAMERSSESLQFQLEERWTMEDLREAVKALSFVLDVPEFKSRSKSMLAMWLVPKLRDWRNICRSEAQALLDARKP